MSNFRPIDRDTGFLLPPSVDEWLPERHLARFVVEVIGGLDLRSMTGSYRGSGEASYHPELLLGLIVYGYATGVFSSRKLERATYDSVAFRFIAANEHPDHDTIAAFRRRFLKQIEFTRGAGNIGPGGRWRRRRGNGSCGSRGTTARVRYCPT
jgi:transposase